MGEIGDNRDNASIYAKYDIRDGQKDGIYIGLTHEFLYSETGNKSVGDVQEQMPEGEYVFSWKVRTGPTCWDDERSWGLMRLGR